MNPKEFLEILHVAERLKDTPRHCTTSRRRTESVAEHSWRVSLMAFLLRNESPIDTWSENEYALNKTYALDTVAFSDWLTSLRQEVLRDTLEKIETKGKDE